MRYSTLLVIGVSGVALLAGCEAPDQPLAPTVARVQVDTPEAYEQLWLAAGNTLRSNYFRLDRQDRQSGVLTTFPETTAAGFEIWRPQPEPAYYWAEANMGTIQRRVTVEIDPAPDEAGFYEVTVQVERLRYGLEERQIDNAAAALRLFSSAAPTTSGKMERPSETAQLIPLGRDEHMENRLLNQILTNYGGAVVTTTQPAEFGVQ